MTKKDKENLSEKKKDRLFSLRQDRRFFSKNINNLENLTYENCVDILSPEDWLVLFESEEELDRAGHYERIFPTRDNIDKYKKLFEINRYNNNMLWKYIKSDRCFLDRLYEAWSNT